MSRVITPRAARIDDAADGIFDLLILGGGISGACAAREGALQGARVLLLESRDFAYGTSSRSSKLLHGGIRYLEQGDVSLVYRALSEREVLCHIAPHLTRPLEFLFPVIEGQGRPAWQVRAGLVAYDLLGSASRLFDRRAQRFPNHRRLLRTDPRSRKLESLGLTFRALFSYFDAQMDDVRLVIENILDADELGATTLNHASVIALSKRFSIDSGLTWHVRWRCGETQNDVESRGRFLLNLAGPWAPEVHRLAVGEPPLRHRPRFSRGTHLLFAQPWDGPGVILPTGEAGRYYFVLPYFAAGASGTLVGTTDRELLSNEDSPEPSAEEVDELLRFLVRDLPGASLTPDRVVRTFAGVRVFAGENAVRSGGARSSSFSRDERIIWGNQYAAVIGGKYTTARRTVELLVQGALQALGFSSPAPKAGESSRHRPLPGARGWSSDGQGDLVENLVESFQEEDPAAAGNRFAGRTVAQFALEAVERFGTRAARLVPSGPKARGAEELLRAMVRMCIAEEQAFSVGDVERRRLGIDLRPDLSHTERREFQRVVADELVKSKVSEGYKSPALN